MQIIAVSTQNTKQYNDFVVKNEGSFLQSFEWGQWQEEQGRKVHRYLMKNDNKNEDVMAAQFIEHSTPFGSYLYCPYGPVLNCRLQIADCKLEITELVNQIRVNQPDLLFIRIEPTFDFKLLTLNFQPTSHTQPDQTLLLNINQTPDKLLASFHPKTRYNIKIAEKHGVTVETFTDVNQKVIDLIMETSNRQKYRNHSREYIEKLWNFFAKFNGDVKATGYLAQVNGKPAAAGLMVDFAKTRMYLFGGSNYELRQSMAPYVLHWQTILDAKQKGLIVYDLGASETASGKSGGFMRFKLGFNPTLVKFGGTFDVIKKRFPYHLYQVFRKINRFIKHA